VRLVGIALLATAALAGAPAGSDGVAWGPITDRSQLGIAWDRSSSKPELGVLVRNASAIEQELQIGDKGLGVPIYDVELTSTAPDGKQYQVFDIRALKAGHPGFIQPQPIVVRLAPGATHELRFPLHELLCVVERRDTRFETLLRQGYSVRARLGGMVSAELAAFEPASDLPSFEANRVLSSNGGRLIPLQPGLLISIYGSHLGPQAGCQGYAEKEHRETPSPLRPGQMFAGTSIYPKMLCDTQVFVGGIPAGLLYVQAGQINFQVPQATPVQGTTEVLVVYKGQSSLPVKLPLNLEPVTVSMESRAAAGMPVWLKVSGYGWDQAVQYPFDIYPAAFKCHDVEVRRDGKLLAPFASLESQAFNGVATSAPPCGFLGLTVERRYIGRIPLHLRYRFDQPGIYEVRYTVREGWLPASPIQVQSAWTRIEIQPGSRRERARWLREMAAHAPTDEMNLLNDYLPSILGIPDEQSLQLLFPYLYDPSELVRRYSMYGLTYWPREQADAAVKQLMKARGPSDATIEFLGRPGLSTADADAVVEGAVPYLRSDSPVLLRGAVIAVYRIALAQNSRVSTAVRDRAEEALMNAAGHITTADGQTIVDYAAALGVVRNGRAREVLWSLVDRDIAREQAAIALTWRGSLSDLPKLAKLALGPAGGNSPGSVLASLPYALHHAYGDAALPYLKEMAGHSPSPLVRTQSAEELSRASQAVKRRP
jgi:hypothetical protein